jgi:site-specific recombinase XerD
MPGYHGGRPPRNKGLRYPADPPTVEQIVAVMRAAGSDVNGARLRALIVILWRAGLRIGEALDLPETDLDPGCGAVLVRKGNVVAAARSVWIAGRRSTAADGVEHRSDARLRARCESNE